MERVPSDILYLDRNENFDPNIKGFISKIIAEADVSRYPDYGNYKSKLSSFLDINLDSILPTSGCTEAIKIFINTFVSNDSITILKNPSYSFAREQIEHKTKNIVYYTDNSKIVNILNIIKPSFFYLCNPNNPTGELLSLDFLKEIIEVCKRINCIIFIDETYYDFCNVSTINLTKQYSNLIVGRSFSKAWGCAGLRMGYLIAHSSLIPLLERQRLKASINTVGCHVITRLIESHKIIQDSILMIKESGESLKKIIKNCGGVILNNNIHTNFIYFSSKTNFFNEFNIAVRRQDINNYVVAIPPLNILTTRLLPYLIV
jgi:histidinol-phosphate aminotransferase